MIISCVQKGENHETPNSGAVWVVPRYTARARAVGHLLALPQQCEDQMCVRRMLSASNQAVRHSHPLLLFDKVCRRAETIYGDRGVRSQLIFCLLSFKIVVFIMGNAAGSGPMSPISPSKLLSRRLNARKVSAERYNVGESLLFHEKVKSIAILISQSESLRENFLKFVRSKAWVGEVMAFRSLMLGHTIVDDEPTSPGSTNSEPSCPLLYYHLPNDDYFIVQPHFDSPLLSAPSSSSRRTVSSSISSSSSSDPCSPCTSRDSFSTHSSSSCPLSIALPSAIPKPQSADIPSQLLEGTHLFLCACLLNAFSVTPEFSEWRHVTCSKAQHGGGQSPLQHMKTMLHLHNNSSEVQSEASDIDLARAFDESDSELHVSYSDKATCPVVLPLEDPRFTNFLHRLVDTIDTESLDSRLARREWLNEVLQYLDDLPFALTVACGRSKRTTDGHLRHPVHKETFPLIFVNKAFELTTGYGQHEVLGRNCKFMQREDCTEMNQVDKLRDALRELQPVKLALTNVRKDSSTYLNFLALQPVCVTNEEKKQCCKFVLGVSYDVAHFQRKYNSQAQSPSSLHSRYSSGRSSSTGKKPESTPFQQITQDLQAIDDLLQLMPLMMVEGLY